MLIGARPSPDLTQYSPTALAQAVCFKPQQSPCDPDFSTKDNKACIAMSTTQLTINKDLYNNMYPANVTSLTQPIPRGKLDLTCAIGGTDDCVATFTLTFNGGTDVTNEALGVDVPEK
ncbi:hypothetical protein H9Q69_001814 [Fusarium xylarioides]|uniref:Uncharacterized protein n=1 Tax=Fusarium xylarioides TaxID=221167 RepID=A0A9P7I3W8_9HYPO|nr:hypothetical protein H9Q72_003593 [Fusarium xylarioides]KAG5799182.1 hypothetical protein H9Q69_001814 [Fusarium xylarioides]